MVQPMELPTKRKTERIAISVDEDLGVVMLYVPYLPEHNHEQIEFTDEAVLKLQAFLNKYIILKFPPEIADKV